MKISSLGRTSIYCKRNTVPGQIYAGGGQIVSPDASGRCPNNYTLVGGTPAVGAPPPPPPLAPAMPPTTVRPDAPLPVQTADKFPPNPNIPWSKWNARPSDAFLIEHHAVDNVRAWFKNALNELRDRPAQLQSIVDYYKTGTVPPGTRSVEVLVKYKPVILEYAAGRGIAVPELSTVPAATTVTPPAAQTKVEEVGKSLVPVNTVEEFKQANPMQQVETGKSASMAAPSEGMSTNMKLGIAVVVLGAGYFIWTRRQA